MRDIKYVFCTIENINMSNIHYVNCAFHSYWILTFDKDNCAFSLTLLNIIKQIS